MVEAWGTYWLFFSGNWYNSVRLRDRGGGLPEPVRPVHRPRARPRSSAPTNRAPVPARPRCSRRGARSGLLYNPFHGNDPGPVIPRPVVMARLGFTPQGPYLAAP